MIRNTWRGPVEIDAVADVPFFTGQVVIQPEKSKSLETSPQIAVGAVVDGITVPALSFDADDDLVVSLQAREGSYYLAAQ